MFIPTWLIFLGSGTLMAIFVLVWGIRNHQFDDQERARYLPLMGLSDKELANQPPVKKGIMYYTFISMMVCAPLSVMLVLFIILKHG